MKRFLLIILLMAKFTGSYAQEATEQEAIKKVLQKEAATWRSGDIKGHADCWQIRPYSRILVSTSDGTALDVPPEAMIHPPANLTGKGGSATQSNFKMSIQKNNAWVSHDEVSISPDGQKSYSYEMRMLEKINGKWKLVGQSIHLYKPK